MTQSGRHLRATGVRSPFLYFPHLELQEPNHGRPKLTLATSEPLAVWLGPRQLSRCRGCPGSQHRVLSLRAALAEIGDCSLSFQHGALTEREHEDRLFSELYGCARVAVVCFCTSYLSGVSARTVETAPRALSSPYASRTSFPEQRCAIWTTQPF